MAQLENNEDVIVEIRNTQDQWELPIDFLESTLPFRQNTVYTVPENTIKFFNFQTSIGEQTAEEKNEQIDAIKEQAKMGIIKLTEQQQQPIQNLDADSSYNSDLNLTVTSPIVTVLNGVTQQSSSVYSDLFNKKSVVEKKTSNLDILKIIKGKTKIGKNEPCVCGSGKKYKKCHGKGE